MTTLGEGQVPAPRSIWGPLGGDFGVRLASALVLLAIAGLVVWQGGWLFAAWIVMACGVMAMEWERLTQAPFLWAGVAIAMAGILAAAVLADRSLYLYALGAAAAGAALAFAHAQLLGRHRRWAFALPLYLGVPAVALIWFREGSGGWLVTLWFLFIVWATDSLAMISGRVFKGPLLAPAISPKKTWSGFFGGTLGAVAVGMGFAALLADRAPDLALAAAIAVISIVGQIGDVMESAIKRRFNAKDAGGSIPGHGGMLDRMDSLLAGTLAFAVMRLVWPGFPFGGA